MRIRPWVITTAAGLCAATAAAIVVLTSTPEGAEPSFFVVLWTSSLLFLWSFFATIFLLLNCSLAQSIWIGGVLVLGGVGELLMIRSGIDDWRLLGGVGFATLLLSIAAWRLFRHE